MRLAGVVVLYNPDNSVAGNINSYIGQLDILYVVDNSDLKNRALISRLLQNEKVCYIDNHGNKGIAKAFNIGAENAIKQNCDFLLTMDQDSRASKNMMERLIEFISKHDTKQLGIVSAYHKQPYQTKCYYLKKSELIAYVMSSGNLLNLSAYRKCGKFLEKFFIDMVDYEYCLRLHMMGYQVIRVNDAVLFHKEGDVYSKNGVLKALHSPVRTYYYVRNYLYVRKKYKEKFPDIIKTMQNNCIIAARTNLRYGGQRLKRILYIIRAFIDYGAGRYGKA